MDLSTILPALLGQVTALFLFLSPLREVKKQRLNGTLTIDSVPFCVTLVQHLLWSVLAGLLEDIWIFMPNFIGIFATVFYTTSALRFNDDQATSRKMEWLLSGGMGFSVLFMMFAMTPILVKDVEVRKSICGSICVAVCIAMYGAPCLEAARATCKKDASRLSLPLAVAGALNGFLWAAYGLSTGVVAVIIPNVLGLVLSLFNIAVKLTCSSYPRSSNTQCEKDQTKMSLLLLQDLEEIVEHEVLIHSIPHEKKLYVPPVAEGEEDVEAELNGVQVRGAAAGIGIRMVRMAGRGIAFRLTDGRFLQVCSRDASGYNGPASYQPAPFGIVAKRLQAAGKESIFYPVPAGGVALHHTEKHMHEYHREETVAFWNPLHKVYLRLNEYGDFDCSPPVQCEADKLYPRMPGGWHWERFEVHMAGAKVGESFESKP